MQLNSCLFKSYLDARASAMRPGSRPSLWRRAPIGPDSPRSSSAVTLLLTRSCLSRVDSAALGNGMPLGSADVRRGLAPMASDEYTLRGSAYGWAAGGCL